MRDSIRPLRHRPAPEWAPGGGYRKAGATPGTTGYTPLVDIAQHRLCPIAPDAPTPVVAWHAAPRSRSKAAVSNPPTGGSHPAGDWCGAAGCMRRARRRLTGAWWGRRQGPPRSARRGRIPLRVVRHRIGRHRVGQRRGPAATRRRHIGRTAVWRPPPDAAWPPAPPAERPGWPAWRRRSPASPSSHPRTRYAPPARVPPGRCGRCDRVARVGAVAWRGARFAALSRPGLCSVAPQPRSGSAGWVAGLPAAHSSRG